MVPTDNGEREPPPPTPTTMAAPPPPLIISPTGDGSSNTRPANYIPIYIPTVDSRLMNHNHSREPRLFDLLMRARPSRDWFSSTVFIGRRSRAGDASEGAGDDARFRFRVPFVRRIKWGALWEWFKNWIKKPKNIALFIWGLAILVSLLLLLFVGIAVTSKPARKRWTEVLTQVINALFTMMCLYEHPRLFHHLFRAWRFSPEDRPPLRKVYCKDGNPRPNERRNLLILIVLLHIAIFIQYYCSAFYWGFPRQTRPKTPLSVGLALGFVVPVVAVVFQTRSTLGKKYDTPLPSEESLSGSATATEEIRIYNRRVVVADPEWIGDVGDCCDDKMVCCLSASCTSCVLGWNLERLGFGNMYVHTSTFLFLCLAPLVIFNFASMNVAHDAARIVVLVAGLVVCFFGLLYGGYWRMQMRERFKLPGSNFCFGSPDVTDCAQWLFCCCCALAQEVRTANFYDVEEGKLCLRVRDEGGRSVLVPLPGEGDAAVSPAADDGSSTRRSRSWPQTGVPSGTTAEVEAKDGPFESVPLGRSSTLNGVRQHHAMQAPEPHFIRSPRSRYH